MTAALIGGGGAAISWMPLDDPGAALWSVRIVFTIVAVLGLVLFVVGLPPQDELPDHLRLLSKGKHFDQDGFAFLPACSARDGVGYLEILFQNQRDCKMIGCVVLQPHADSFRETGCKAAYFEVYCEASAFGVARLPIAVPYDQQGQIHFFNVGVRVEFPGGKGGLLRFGRGLQVGVIDAASLAVACGKAPVSIANLLEVSPVVSFPARIGLLLPMDVLNKAPPGLSAEIELLKGSTSPSVTI